MHQHLSSEMVDRNEAAVLLGDGKAYEVGKSNVSSQIACAYVTILGRVTTTSSFLFGSATVHVMALLCFTPGNWIPNPTESLDFEFARSLTTYNTKMPRAEPRYSLRNFDVFVASATPARNSGSIPVARFAVYAKSRVRDS